MGCSEKPWNALPTTTGNTVALLGNPGLMVCVYHGIHTYTLASMGAPIRTLEYFPCELIF